MRTVTVDWEFLEVEDDEWAAFLAQNPLQRFPLQASSWRHARIGVAIADLIALLLAVAGFRLWNEAQQGITQIEGDVVALVRAETLRQNVVGPSDQLQAAVQAVEIDRSGLMARVVVTETSGLNYIWSFTESRFYTSSPSGWRRSDPLISFWGKEATLDTANLHFTYHELDRQVVEAVADPLDAYVSDLRVFLGLPALAPTKRITVVITPEPVTRGSISADGMIQQPSPFLLRIPIRSNDESVLFTRLRSLLLVRTMDEVIARANVQAEWLPIMESLQWWLERNDVSLVKRGAGEAASSLKAPAQCASRHISMLFYLHEDVEQPSDAIAFDADVLFDFVMSGKTQASVPILLSAFGHHTSWESLTPEVFGVSYEELRLVWSCGS
jgi:hypothetical protein